MGGEVARIWPKPENRTRSVCPRQRKHGRAPTAICAATGLDDVAAITPTDAAIDNGKAAYWTVNNVSPLLLRRHYCRRSRAGKPRSNKGADYAG
jgi:hypothetical protein